VEPGFLHLFGVEIAACSGISKPIQNSMPVKFVRWLVGARFIAIAFAMVLLPLAAYAQNSGRQLLKGHVPAAVSRLHLQSLGRLSATQRLNLAIGLPLRNQQALDTLLQQIYDPASPNYRHYLTPEQFTEQFGPTEQDYEAVVNFATKNGLTVTYRHPNRVVLDVSGSVPDIEKAFHVAMQVYQHPTEARTFYMPDVEPSVDLTVPILHISGLDNYSLPRPANLKIKPIGQMATPEASGANATLNSGSGPGGLYMGNDFRAAYTPGVTLDGSGQVVGLLQFDGYYTNDIAAYENQAGLPNVTLTNVLINGFSGNPTTNVNAVAEVSLDIEMAISMAPGIFKVVVYEAPNGSTAWSTILSRIADDNLAKQISCSWSGGSPDAAVDGIFKQMASQGQSFFCASGDNDAFNGSIPFLLDNTNITLVGGTVLTTTGAGGSYVSETVWNDRTPNPNGGDWGSSGGISPTYAMPSWQQGIDMTTNHGSTTMRNVPDVALTGANIFIVADNNQYESASGTSCAAPLWAGFTALVNQQAATFVRPTVGFVNPAIYAIGKGTDYTNDFHDITTGDNTWSDSPTNFYAVHGYDLCTGWGTPAGQNLINTLAGPPDVLDISPFLGFNSYGAIGGPFTITSQMFTLTNLGGSSLSWSLANTSSWFNVSSTGGTLPVAGQTDVTVSLNSTASNLVVGTYTATVFFTNQTSGVVQSRQFMLQVVEPLLITPDTGFTAIGLFGGPFNVTSQFFSLTNIGTASFDWSLVNTSAWLNVSSTGGTLAVGGSDAVTVSLSSVASNLALGDYVATLCFSNRTSGVVQNRQFTLVVAILTDGFEGLPTMDFSTGQTMGKWMVMTNQVSIVTDPTNAYDGTNYLALADGAISQTLSTVAGKIYSLSIAYRGPGIVGMWRGENNGDDSIYGNNGTLTEVTFTPGEVGQAFVFHQREFGDWRVAVNISDQTVYVLTNSLSIEGWVRPEGNEGKIFWRGDNRPGYDPYVLYEYNNDAGFTIMDASNNFCTIEAPLALNQWSHVAGVLDGNSGVMKLYVNGVVAVHTNTAIRPFGNLNPTLHPGVCIGNVNDGNFLDPFYGDLDEISLYSRALSASEVGAIYNAGSAGKFDSETPFPQNLAEAAITIDGAPMGIILGNNTNWQTQTITFTAKQDGTLLQIRGIEPGMLLDDLQVFETTLAITPTNGFAATGPIGGPFNITAQSFSLTNLAGTSLNWSLINTSLWLNASITSGTLEIGGQTNVTVSLNFVASNLTAGTYTATILFTNQIDAIPQSRQFTLQVFDPLVITPTNGFTASGPVGGPFSTTSQIFSLANAGTTSLGWSLASTSSWLNASPGSGTLTASSWTNVTVSLNPAVTNLAAGTYTASLFFTNLNNGDVQSRQFNLLIGGTIQNGGFETGDFSYWTLWGDTNTTSVSKNSLYKHSGSYGAELRTPDLLGSGYISQTVMTVPGQKYLLSLWLNSSSNPDPGYQTTPNEFSIIWGGTNLFDQANIPVNADWTNIVSRWMNLQFIVTATTSSTVLQFEFLDNPWQLGLDDVSLWPWPIAAPSFQSVTQSGNTVWLNWTALTGLPYQLQYRTNLTQGSWINLGSVVTATNMVMTIPDVPGSDPQRYYRIQWTPAY
jgi:subtilase family serine protease